MNKLLQFRFLLISTFSLIFAFATPQSKQQHEMTASEIVQSLDYANFPQVNSGCISNGCHVKIEPIRQHGSKMASMIYQKGEKVGDPNGCIVCHAGSPFSNDKNIAHENMIKFPASLWVIDKTCGECHPKHVYNIHRNLRNVS